METVTLQSAAPDKPPETVQIPTDAPGPYRWVGRAIKTREDHTNMWWERNADSDIFIALPNGSRSNPPGRPFYQLPE